MRFKSNEKNLRVWHRWYAWYPVSFDGNTVWGEHIERRCEFGATFGDQFNYFRFIGDRETGKEHNA